MRGCRRSVKREASKFDHQPPLVPAEESVDFGPMGARFLSVLGSGLAPS